MITIVLLSYSTSWSRNEYYISFTGVEQQALEDSVLVPISALRQANAKMIELKYEKEINTNLRQVIANDSIIINEYNTKLNNSERKSLQYKRKAKVASGVSAGLLVLLIFSLIK